MSLVINRYNNSSEYSDTMFSNKKNQKEMCLEYLERYGSITPLEALTAFGCFRLAAVIFKLRKDGYPIRMDINDDGKKYAIYTLVREEN